jgi:hypothetical protein
MSMRRLFRGVLEVVTPSGTHYLSPSFTERLYLIWMFRNFRTLPLNVLTESQRKRIELMASTYNKAEGHQCDEILGSIESVPPIKRMPRKFDPQRAAPQPVAPMRARSVAHGD